jgi:trehalose/maltose hydrolase-like predicted phosphorylase
MFDDTWTICETQFDPSTNRAYEGLFTVSSGYLHMRSSLE